MGQAKIPAKCEHCGAEGPPRQKAIAAGWWKLNQFERAQPRWLCPKCKVPHIAERRKRYESTASPSLESLVAATMATILRRSR